MMQSGRLSANTQDAVIRLAMNDGRVRLHMRGRSMLPDLREGMVLHLERRQRARAGDIVVFRAGSQLIAHRVVGVETGRVVCSGDAQPDMLELVGPQAIVGTVVEIRDGSGRRVDTLAMRLRGLLRARTQRLRAILRLTLPKLRPRGYAVLVAVMSAVLRADTEALREAIRNAPPLRLARLARRHRCAAALAAAVSHLRGDEMAQEISAVLGADRWAVRARRSHFVRQVQDVVRTLRAAGIEPVLLKGAHRALALDEAAEEYESVDIDLLVSRHESKAACAALVASGYEQPAACATRAFYAGHHHAPPLVRAGGVPVEIHHALERDPVAAPNDAVELAPFITRISLAGETYRVLDATGSALHLALHCLHRPALRELLLLSAQLRRLNPLEIKRLRGLMEREDRYAIALNAALLFAAELAGVPWPANDAARRYARWMLLREDLPRPLRARTAGVDAWLSRADGRFSAAWRAAFSGSRGSLPARAVRGIAFALCGIAAAVYARFMTG